MSQLIIEVETYLIVLAANYFNTRCVHIQLQRQLKLTIQYREVCRLLCTGRSSRREQRTQDEQ